MSLTTVYRTDSFDAWRIKTNTISQGLGDVSIISSDIVNRTDVVTALNDLISYIGSAALTTASQNLRGAVNEIKGSSITFGGTKTFSGPVVLQSTLGVTGATTLGSFSASSGSVSGALGVTGAATVGSLVASSGSVSGAFGISGTATHSGLTIFSTALNDNSIVFRVTNSHSAFTAAPNRITIDTAGNVVINGNLSVAGSSSFAGTVATSVDWSSVTNKPSPVVQVSLAGALTGSGSATMSSLGAGTYTATVNASLAAGAVTLGTHTTGNYVATAAAGTGISLAGSGSGPFFGALTITNSDRGSSQNIFKTIAVSGQTSIVASSNTDTLTVVAGTNITVTTDGPSKTLTISASSAAPNNSTININAGTGMTGGGSFTLNQATTGNITLTNNDRGSSQNIFKTIASAGSTSLVAASNTDTLTFVAGQVSTTQGISISLSAGQNVTISHFDTSTVANSTNSAGNVIQSLTFDTYGHVLTIATTDLDARYLQAEVDTLNTVTNRGASTANSITVGGLTVSGSGNASIGGNLTVTGNLIVNGTTTTVSSTTITVQDPVITLGGSSAPVANDGKDRGVEYRYFSSAAKVGWFGRRNTNGRFAYIPDATNTSEVFTGTLGEIEATTFYGALSGNATTATALATPRNINGVAFDGTASITITANTTNALTIGSGLTGTSFNGSTGVTIALAASGVGAGSTVGSASAIPVITYDSFGRITGISTAAVNNGSLTLAVSGVGLSGSASFSANQSGASTFTVTSNATSANTASTLVSRDASGNFSAGTITATLNGNATSASSASSVAWTNVSGRPTVVSAFTNDANYTVSGTSVAFSSVAFSTSSVSESWGIRFSAPGTQWPGQFSHSLLVGIAAAGADYGTGNLYASGNVIAYYSDERLKNIEGPITGALNKVQQLNGFYYRGNEKAAELGYDTEKRQVGVSAQSVEAVLPEVVSKAAVAMDGTNDYKTVDYAKLVPLLIEAIKELSVMVQDLKNNR